MENDKPKRGDHFDEGKAKLHLIPREALLGMAKAFEYGMKKYKRYNYRSGIEYTKLTDSAMRHLLAFLDGEDTDPESGLSHLQHLLANAAMLEYNRIRHPELDDRHCTEEKK